MSFHFDWREQVRSHPRYGGYYQAVAGKPSWVTRTAIAAAVLVIVIPLVLLTLAAVVVGAVVFTVLGAVAWVLHRVRLLTGAVERPTAPSGPEQSSRENVRIIRDS